MKKIALALVDDWELRGNGTGNVLELQHKPALKLMDVYEKHNIRGTFTVEVLQQLAFEEVAPEYEEIRSQKDIWKETLKQIKSRGNDVQLHLHIQWHEAVYQDGSWKLKEKWNIADYPPEIIDGSIKKAKDYLKEQIKPLDPDHKIVAFRAGSWAMQPSKNVLECLEKHKIEIDISVCQGIYQNDQKARIDYRDLQEPYFPYFPAYDDLTRVSEKPTAIIEIPTQSVILPGVRIYNKLLKVKSKILRSREVEMPERMAFDLGGMTFDRMKSGIDGIMARALKSEKEFVPIVLENHTKDLAGADERFEEISRFIYYIKEKFDKWVDFMTLREIRDIIVENKEKLVRVGR